MKKTINKLVLAFFLIVVSLVNAAPPQPQAAPTGSGNGGNGTGAPAPIDMYVYVLGIVAIAFIVYFTKKYKSVKA